MLKWNGTEKEIFVEAYQNKIEQAIRDFYAAVDEKERAEFLSAVPGRDELERKMGMD